MKIIAIIEARMGSSRLAGKVLMPLGDSTVLQFMVNRVKVSTKIKDVIVATSTNPLDDAIEKVCRENDISLFRGDENNVLKRVCQTADYVHSFYNEIGRA